MREFRKVLLWALLLVIVVLAGDRLASALLTVPLQRSHFRFSELHRSGIDAEILVVGDSRGVSSFNVPFAEKLLGRRTYSICYNGMAIEISEALLADYLDHNRAPKLVVVEVSSAMEEMKLSPELRTYMGLSPRLAAIYAKEHPVAARAGRVFHLLRYNSELYLRSLYYLRRSDQAWSNQSTIGAGELALAQTGGPWTLPARPNNVEALARIVRLAESRGAEVRLLIGPYLPARAARWANREQFIGAIEASAHRVDPNLHVWNYAAGIDDPALFGDTLHLNESGTEAFISRLARDGFFGSLETKKGPVE